MRPSSPGCSPISSKRVSGWGIIQTLPWAGLVKAQYPGVLRAAAEQVIVSFTAAQPEADLPALLQMKDFPVSQLLSRTLGYLYSVCYVPQAIRTSLEVLMALNPKDEYPEARAMDRHFILHLGGTNTGQNLRRVSAP